MKLFLDGMKQVGGLSSRIGMKVFEIVYRLLQETPNTDKLALSWRLAAEMGYEIPERTFRHGLRQLLEREFPDAFEARGLRAGGSDIVDRGYGEHKDFLSPLWLHLDHPIANVVTNPPFNRATEFLLKSLDIATDKVCILQRLAWLEGKARREIFESTPLARVWVFSRRISMPPGESNQPAKGGSVAFAWYVWEQGHRGPPTLRWLP